MIPFGAFNKCIYVSIYASNIGWISLTDFKSTTKQFCMSKSTLNLVSISFSRYFIGTSNSDLKEILSYFNSSIKHWWYTFSNNPGPNSLWTFIQHPKRV